MLVKSRWKVVFKIGYMDGTSDCTMSLRRWQKLTAVRTRKRVPSSIRFGVAISVRAMVWVLMPRALENSHYHFSVSCSAARIKIGDRSILEIVWAGADSDLHGWA